MAPKRSKNRNVDQSVPVSDYETDQARRIEQQRPPGQHSQQLGAGQRTNEELNLLALRRHYPDVVNVKSVAPYVVLYSWLAESGEWDKDKWNVEGTMFVVELEPTVPFLDAPRYAVIILNRRSLDNFFVELLKADDIQVNEEYVMIQEQRHDEIKVWGLWIFSEPAPSSTATVRDANARMIQACAAHADDSRSVDEESLNRRFESGNRPENRFQDVGPAGRSLSIQNLFAQANTNAH